MVTLLTLWLTPSFAQEPGDVIWGTYRVARITENGETEDYADKMGRAGRALDEDCITTALLFDFGPSPAEGATAHRPDRVGVRLQQRCKRGGLGVYGAELSVQVAATWSTTEAGLALSTPEVDVKSDYTRLKEPADGDMRTPPHWLAPEQHIDRDAISYLVEVDKPRWKQRPTMRLVTEGTVLHLEPDDGKKQIGDK